MTTTTETTEPTQKGGVQMQREGHVSTLIFGNPPRNMLTTGMFAELGRHVHVLDADPNCARRRHSRRG